MKKTMNGMKLWLMLGASALGTLGAAAADRPNVLLMTVDDMNCDSIGVFGCKVPGTTPNIDKLAAEGMRFNHAHVTIAVCQPCRAALVTGMYPHKSGVEGFERLPQTSSIQCLQDYLKAAGYRIGKMGKSHHADPNPKTQWDLCTDKLPLVVTTRFRRHERHGYAICYCRLLSAALYWRHE